MNNIAEIYDLSDWELIYVKLHKKCPVDYPMDIEKCRNGITDELIECETGMCLGEGWHGGLTHEQWKQRRDYQKS